MAAASPKAGTSAGGGGAELRTHRRANSTLWTSEGVTETEADEEDEEEQQEEEAPAVDKAHSMNTRRFLWSMRRAHRNSLQKLQECQEATQQSPARQQAVKVSMASVYTSVGAAQVGSSLARRMVQPVRNNTFWDGKQAAPEVDMSSVVPMYLGHLTLPLPQQKRDELGLQEAEFSLPGAVGTEQPEPSPFFGQEKPTSRGRSAGAAAVARDLDPPSSRGKSAGSCGLGSLTNSRPQTGSSDPSKPRELYLAEKVMSGAVNSARREQDTETPCVEDLNSDVPASRGADNGGQLVAELDGFESTSEEGSEGSKKKQPWPPRGPLQRFKAVMQFSESFQAQGKTPSAKTPTEGSRAASKISARLQAEPAVKETEVHDSIVRWLNKVFALSIRTDVHVTSGFPLILLIAMDAIYPERVKWCQVDWDLKYQTAVYKNYAILMVLWKELNMERAREFRDLELDGMPTADLADKLDFLRLLKRWFEQRIYTTHSTYLPLERRKEYLNHCRMWGHDVSLPCWINSEDKVTPRRSQFSHKARAFELMPEYKRLIWFLGSTEHQNM